MGKCEFNLKYQGSKQGWMDKIQTEIHKAKGSIYFQGDSGNFSIPILSSQIKGNFHFLENQVLITISDKPFFLTCAKIESQISEYLLKQKD